MAAVDGAASNGEAKKVQSMKRPPSCPRCMMDMAAVDGADSSEEAQKVQSMTGPPSMTYAGIAASTDSKRDVRPA